MFTKSACIFIKNTGKHLYYEILLQFKITLFQFEYLYLN